MFDVGGGELILILLVVLLLFGPKKLPELARSVGKGLRQVRRAQEDLTQQIRDISAEVAEPINSMNTSVNTPEVFTPKTPDTVVPREEKKSDDVQ